MHIIIVTWQEKVIANEIDEMKLLMKKLFSISDFFNKVFLILHWNIFIVKCHLFGGGKSQMCPKCEWAFMKEDSVAHT